MGSQDGAGETGHGVAVVGQVHLTGVAGDELSTGGRLELAHLLAHGWLTEANLHPGLGETLGFGHGEKGLEQNGIKHNASFEKVMGDIDSIYSQNDWAGVTWKRPLIRNAPQDICDSGSAHSFPSDRPYARRNRACPLE